MKWVFCMIMVMMVVISYPSNMGAAEANQNKESSISVPYTVKPGDTLFAISKKYYLTGQFEQVAKANGLDPKAGLKAGAVIKLNNPLVLDYYAVQQGDTVYAITNRYFNRTKYMDALMTYNGITSPDTGLKIGMALRIPLPSGEGKHTVLKGDTLYNLSVRYFKAQDYQQAIVQANGMDAASSKIQAGDDLQIPNPYYRTKFESKAAGIVPAKLSIEIDITKNKLYVKSGGTVKKSFNIASGKKAGLTPTGSFEIMTKIENPWYSAKGIPGGDPKNPLGSRWLGLSVPNTQGTKYGIHGTNAPSSIGTNASAGCIRMLNEDVEWLFDMIPNGTEVTIHK
ncbi:LysM peptidoglycan-binding domain-containing protein [Paenibacillus lupini]